MALLPPTTPPMGWNTWFGFGPYVTDAIVRAQAAAMVSSGMRDAGYVFILIDDGWQGTRDADGHITSNQRFPDMKALGDYIHGLGLRFGIYSTPGPKSCSLFEGSYGHEEDDARTFASWGVDYLKYDLCSFSAILDPVTPYEAQHELLLSAYRKMYEAIQKTGRPMVYSLCEYGFDEVWKWGPSVGGNLWRTNVDLEDNYATLERIGFAQAGLAPYAGAGHWNDPDLLQVGLGAMNADEYRTQMSLWALLAAPLIATNDLTRMSPETRSILMNPDVIAVDQDPGGRQGDRVSVAGLVEVWARPLEDGSKAIGIFNRGTGSAQTQISLTEFGFADEVVVRDLWTGTQQRHPVGTYSAQVPAHGVVMLRIWQVRPSGFAQPPRLSR